MKEHCNLYKQFITPQEKPFALLTFHHQGPDFWYTIVQNHHLNDSMKTHCLIGFIRHLPHASIALTLGGFSNAR
jgi:hypothetical protein